MLYQIMCPNCGAKRLEKINDTQYYCEYCAETFFAEKIEDYTKELSKLLDMTKLEMASTAKQNLYNAVKDGFVKPEAAFKKEEPKIMGDEKDTAALESVNQMFAGTPFEDKTE